MAIKNKTKSYSIKNLTDPSTTHKLQKIFISANTIKKSTYYYLEVSFYSF